MGRVLLVSMPSDDRTESNREEAETCSHQKDSSLSLSRKSCSGSWAFSRDARGEVSAGASPHRRRNSSVPGTCRSWRLPTIVINELHTDPDVKTEQVEFVELHNAGTTAVDLGGWRLDGGVFYTFPAGTKLAAGGYLIVTQSPEQAKAKWSTLKLPAYASRVLGPFGGKLDNESDTITLCDAAGQTVDEVTYQLGFPWPMVGEPLTGTTAGTGGSMQLVNPIFDNDLGGSWRSALPTPAAANSGILSSSLPPQIRQVRHSPKQPASGEVVTITAKSHRPGRYPARHAAVPGGRPGRVRRSPGRAIWLQLGVGADARRRPERRRGGRRRRLHDPRSRPRCRCIANWCDTSSSLWTTAAWR